MKKICMFLVIVCILLPIHLVAGAETEDDTSSSWQLMSGTEYVQVCEKDGYILAANPDNGFFRITSTVINYEFCSNPEDYAEDEYARGSVRGMLASQLILTCIDEKGQLFDLQSMADSLLEGGFKMYCSDAGIGYRMNFPKFGLSITMYIFLEGDTVRVTVPTDKTLTDTNTCRIVSVTVLPYFNTGGLSEKGFIFVPDGSGGIIRFNNNKQTSEGYSQRVFGRDAANFMNVMPANAESVLMPVFGISKEIGGGSFAVITKGAAQATIHGNTSKGISAYNNAYVSFQLRGYEEITTLSRTWAEKKFVISAHERLKDKMLEVNYKLFSKNDTSLMDMANYYRGYLTENGLEKHQISNYPLYLDIYMGVKKKKQFLGFVYDGYQTLTTFSQAQKMADTYYNSGADGVVIRAIGASPNGAYGGAINKKFNISGAIGGKKEYAKLQEYLAGKNGALYFEAQLASYEKSSFGYSKSFDRAVSIEQKPIRLYQYRLSLLERRLDIPPLYLLKANKIELAADSLGRSLKSNNVNGVSPSDIASTPYSTYNNGKFTSRDEMLNRFSSALDKLSNHSELLLQAPVVDFSYKATRLAGVPSNGSMTEVIDTSVPFFAMVLHGYIQYASKPINISSQPERMIMNVLECGASPTFAFIHGDYSDVSGTPLEYLYSAEYSAWKARSEKIYADMADFMGGLFNIPISGFSILSDEIHTVSYQNGVTLIFNYTDFDFEYRGVTVSAKSCMRTED